MSFCRNWFTVKNHSEEKSCIFSHTSPCVWSDGKSKPRRPWIMHLYTFLISHSVCFKCVWDRERERECVCVKNRSSFCHAVPPALLSFSPLCLSASCLSLPLPALLSLKQDSKATKEKWTKNKILTSLLSLSCSFHSHALARHQDTTWRTLVSHMHFSRPRTK